MKLRILCLLVIGAFCLTPAIAKTARRSAKIQPKVTLQWPRFQRQDRSNYVAAYAALNFLLHYHGFRTDEDGFYWKQTEADVKEFQRRKGLKIDGMAGPQTLRKLIVRLKRGDRGEAVKALQIALFGGIATKVGTSYRYSSYSSETDGKLDGVFDLVTEKAVRQRQKDEGLKADGIVDAATWCILLGGKVKK